MRFEDVTLHVDREQFDRRLFEAALGAGVAFVWDRVRAVYMDGDRVSDCVTSTGRRHQAQWYIDASGRSRVVGRAAHVTIEQWGRERVGLWRYQPSGIAFEGTILHFDETAHDLVWAWEIPIGAERSSVGVVMPVTEFKEVRRGTESVEGAMSRILLRFPSLDATRHAGPVNVRTFQPFVSQRVVGPNWLMVGEAAALVDPLSSSGVASAIRHGTEAAATIVSAEGSPEARDRLLARYDRRVSDVARLYNEALDRLLYQPQLRQRFSMRHAARSYVIVGYLTSAIYNRVEPANSTVRRAAMTFTIRLFHLWIRLHTLASHTAVPRRP